MLLAVGEEEGFQGGLEIRGGAVLDSGNAAEVEVGGFDD